MASIEVGPLVNHLDEEDLALIEETLDDGDIDVAIDDDAEMRLVDGTIDEVFFDEFYDRLDANNLACDIYLPCEFDDIIQLSEYRVGSAASLILVLEEMRDDIFEGDDDEGEEGDEGVMESYDDDSEDDVGIGTSDDLGTSDMNSDSMRYIWETLMDTAKSCMSEGTVLYLRR